MEDMQRARAEVKRMLKAYAGLCSELEQIEVELEEMERGMVGIRGVDRSGMPGSSLPGRPAESAVIPHVVLQERYQAMKERAERAQMELEDMFAVLEPLERRVMRSRYIRGLTWREVAEEIHCSTRHVHRLKDRAIFHLSETYVTKCHT